jgi:hypothetical protein
VLTEHEGISAVDIRGRTPLHFTLSNAGRKAAPAAVRLLLGLNKDIVNSHEAGGPLPLRVLAEYSATVRKDGGEEQRDSVRRCLEFLLLAEPYPTPDFFTALQSLPDWLQEKAVVMPVVQLLLNDKISQRFPTSILMSDFYVQAMVIIFYSLEVPIAIDRRFDEYSADYEEPIETKYLIPLYVGAAYFLLREIIQVLSLISLNVRQMGRAKAFVNNALSIESYPFLYSFVFMSLQSFHLWMYDPSNYLNVVYVFVVFWWAVRMNTGEGDKEFFRTGAALSVVVLWLKLLSYLRNMMIEFAVFVGGVFYVVQRLAAFLVSLAVILVAFSQMFFTIFRQNDIYCIDQPNDSLTDEEQIANLQCDDPQTRAYCNRWDAFLNVFTMLMGEVNGLQFVDSAAATVLFIIFMFLVVILLANVLIAIVTDSYKVISEQRAAIVFWTNRLDFIAEMDAVANGPWKRYMKATFGMKDDPNPSARKRVTFGHAFWKRLMDLFEDDVDDGVMSVDFLVITLLRFGTAFFVIPMWIFIGLISVGILWPPQIREAVFTSSIFKHNTEQDKEDEMRRNQVKKLREEVKILKDDIMQDLAIDRTQVVQLKSLVSERKQDIQNEMKHIKRIVTMLFEQQSSM